MRIYEWIRVDDLNPGIPDANIQVMVTVDDIPGFTALPEHLEGTDLVDMGGHVFGRLVNVIMTDPGRFIGNVERLEQEADEPICVEMAVSLRIAPQVSKAATDARRSA